MKYEPYKFTRGAIPTKLFTSLTHNFSSFTIKLVHFIVELFFQGHKNPGSVAFPLTKPMYVITCASICGQHTKIAQYGMGQLYHDLIQNKLPTV